MHVSRDMPDVRTSDCSWLFGLRLERSHACFRGGGGSDEGGHPVEPTASPAGGSKMAASCARPALCSSTTVCGKFKTAAEPRISRAASSKACAASFSLAKVPSRRCFPPLTATAPRVQKVSREHRLYVRLHPKNIPLICACHCFVALLQLTPRYLLES